MRPFFGKKGGWQTVANPDNAVHLLPTKPSKGQAKTLAMTYHQPRRDKPLVTTALSGSRTWNKVKFGTFFQQCHHACYVRGLTPIQNALPASPCLGHERQTVYMAPWPTWPALHGSCDGLILSRPFCTRALQFFRVNNSGTLAQ